MPIPRKEDRFIECGQCGSFRRVDYYGPQADCRNDAERFDDVPEDQVVSWLDDPSETSDEQDEPKKEDK